MGRFKIFINYDVLEEVPKSGKTRAEILRFIESLAEKPLNSGDFDEIDDVGRPVYTKIIRKYAITYWPDTPVKEVKIIRIRKADGGSTPG